MNPSPQRRIRWWPALVILILEAAGVTGVHELLGGVAFQTRNLTIFAIGLAGLLALTIWWLAFSRARWITRLLVLSFVLALFAALNETFRIRGVNGDFVPIIEMRWKAAAEKPASMLAPVAVDEKVARPDFPQFLGPNRNCIVEGPALARDWQKQPPQVVWRLPIGTGWAGFAIAGKRAVTLEQRGEQEIVTCLDVLTGKRLWEHADAAHYKTTIAGEGPRTTPTISGGRVFTLGATGILNCLDLETGLAIWTRKLTDDAHVDVPMWGFASSPLLLDDKVIVSAGGADGRSLVAYRADDGKPAWTGGSEPINYSSPFFTTLADVPQILMFNTKFITAHDPKTGAVLWEYPWGVGQPHVALPVPVGLNRVVFSSGYGVGTQLLEVTRGTDGKLAAKSIWKTLNLRAKFANFIHHDGFLYALDDGILECLDPRDGSRKWKDGRYGHGQMLLDGDLLLVTAETGELILLAPTTDAPHELARFSVFQTKTWNPSALSGDLLLMRTDMEAACVRLPLAEKK